MKAKSPQETTSFNAEAVQAMMQQRRPMMKLLVFAGTALLLMVCVAVLWGPLRHEPRVPPPAGPGFVYQGRTIEDWVSRVWIPNRKENPEVQTVIDIGEAAVPYLVQRLQNRSSRLERNSLYGKAWFALPKGLQRHLAEPAGDSAAEALSLAAVVYVLGGIGPQAADAVPALAQIAEDKSLGLALRLFTVQALGQIGPGAQTSGPVLVDCLRDQRQWWRREFRKQGEREIESKDLLFRASAARALACVGGYGAEAKRGLQSLVASTNVAARANSAVALWRMDSASYSNLVAQLLQSPDRELREKTIMCLGAVGPPAAGFLSTIKLLAGETNQLHNVALLAIKRIEAKIPSVGTNSSREKAGWYIDEVRFLHEPMLVLAGSPVVRTQSQACITLELGVDSAASGASFTLDMPSGQLANPSLSTESCWAGSISPLSATQWLVNLQRTCAEVPGGMKQIGTICFTGVSVQSAFARKPS